ncbi:MAG: DUF523 and DUF1722 domain-containing protein [Thermodesulfovibrionales bacterium]|nr:DUF523 and DUF1722 domain-containing protein [Thermodesulfovibrionales bacterium]
MNSQKEQIKVGISSCLLGEKVRYDGGHKLDKYLKETLGKYVKWITVCPEVEMGLPVPREAMRLTGNSNNPRLVTVKTHIDYTDNMITWAKKRLKELEKEEICGFIFKSDSPSSGMRKVKVYSESGIPYKNGVGIFAKLFMEHFPLIPVEDDGRMNDPSLRENFIERIFVYKRWRNLLLEGFTIAKLIEFHTTHKFLILSHSPKHYSLLGKLVANAAKMEQNELQTSYFTLLIEALKLLATVKKNTNVLQHIYGYLKKYLTDDEKNELNDIIHNYHKQLYPLIVPITLIKFLVKKYDEPYLKSQVYLNPHPIELMLRNHV